MIISVVNHSNGQVTDEELQTAIRAINRQINEDFAPYWSLPATLRLEGRSSEEPDRVTISRTFVGFRSGLSLPHSRRAWVSLGQLRCRTKRWSC